MLLNKKQASLVIKLGALILAITFAVGVLGLIPSLRDGGTNRSSRGSEEQQKEFYQQELARIEGLLSEDTKNKDLWIELGNLHFDNKNYAKAVEAYTKAVEFDPDNVNVIVDLGTSYFNLNKLAEAKQQFELVIGKDPNHLIALYNLGVVSAREGDEKAAKEYWSKVVELAPQAEIGKAAKTALDSLR